MSSCCNVGIDEYHEDGGPVDAAVGILQCSFSWSGVGK